VKINLGAKRSRADLSGYTYKAVGRRTNRGAAHGLKPAEPLLTPKNIRLFQRREKNQSTSI